MNINEKQNSDWNLMRLAAQRQLYSEAKKIMMVQFILSGIIVVILAFFGNIIEEKYLAYTIVVAIIIAILDEFLLSKKIDGIKEGAAIIQEEFDCEVLQLPQNKIKNDNVSMIDTIQEKSKEYLTKHKDYRALINWYPGLDEEEDNRYFRLICQTTNCWWNQKLRKRYSGILMISISCVFVILLFISIFKGINVSAFFTSVLFPIFPAFLLVYKTIRDNNKAIRNLNQMKRKLEEIISNAENCKNYSNEQLFNDSRCFQDMIFDNRSLSPLIPDKLYFKQRNRFEEIAQETNRELIKRIKALS